MKIKQQIHTSKWRNIACKIDQCPKVTDHVDQKEKKKHLGTIFIACHCAEYGQAGPTNVDRLKLEFYMPDLLEARMNMRVHLFTHGEMGDKRLNAAIPNAMKVANIGTDDYDGFWNV
uniref:Uncharacterized protein n=1 Tax=Populus trichocarpa TaxID=3694 RepID=B9GIQ4_POPTR